VCRPLTTSATSSGANPARGCSRPPSWSRASTAPWSWSGPWCCCWCPGQPYGGWWLPAYPIAVVVLGAFVVYEMYRATHTGSVLLPLLAVLDIAIIVVIMREYRLLRRG
jgi:hypothetical protein